MPAVPSTTGTADDEPVGGSGGPAADTQFGTIDDVLDLLQGVGPLQQLTSGGSGG